MTTSPPSPRAPIDEPGRPAQEVTIGILTALVPEARAMVSLIDDVQDYRDPQDRNLYRVGTVPSAEPDQPHRVAVLMMPRDGTKLAATCCANMLRTFPNIQTVIMTGIAGGIPRPHEPEKHVRLGDIVVALDGIVDYGHVRQANGTTELRGRQSSGLISSRLLGAARELQMAEQGGDRRWDRWLDPERTPAAAGFARPPEDTDILYVRGNRVAHPPRPEPEPPEGMPRVHSGVIGSADVLMRDEDVRDALAERFPDMLAVEMEGSGIAASTASNDRTWFMVRGVADYGEMTGKNDRWHQYASYTAAAYVRALLEMTPPAEQGPQTRLSGRALPLVTDAQQEQLDRVLRRVRPGIDVRAVWQSTVPELEPPPDVLTAPEHAYHYLARLNADAAGLHPAIVFIAHLSAATGDPGLAADLMDWVTARTDAARTTAAMRARLNPSAGTPAGASGTGPALLIEVTVDGLDRGNCRITPYVQGETGPWRPQPGPRETAEVPVQQVEDVVSQLVAEAEAQWETSKGPAGIEFLLPTGLLNLKVQWFSAPPLFGRVQPLCVQYSVVVRSLERMRERGVHRAWAGRWERLDTKPFSGKVQWGVNARTKPDLDAWAAGLSGDDHYVVVVLSEPPTEEWGRQELFAALAAGVPIVVWDQRLPRPDDAAEGIEGLVAEPADLPENIRRVRVLAETLIADQPDHYGRSVALLWDDPDRLVSAGRDRS
jgi:nucleoside phosphorylase